ncbi:glucose-6-phosphate 3-dehydrogenase [Streptomyces sp. SAI-170]|uniref:Gfo/Idh/MocA family protein n=1 Tax=Streptomyces sp. SAI-170 TaxID=3377729 RepID=UPI003C7BB0AD
MRVGIVGAGNIGRVHARTVLACERTTLAGLYDIDADRAREAAGELGVPAFASLEELCAAAEGVVVASPNRTHAAHALAVLDHGRHVLCEKPMAVSLAEAAAMRERAAASPVTAGVGFNYRCLPVVRAVRERVDDGRLGRVLHADLAFRRASALTRRHFTWRDGAAERSTSGALGDLGVHLLDLLHFLFRSPVDTGACQVALRTKVGTKGGRPVEVDDHAFVSGRLHTGPHFTLTASKASTPDDVGLSLTLTGSRGELAYHSRDGSLLLERTGVDWEPVKLLGPARLDDPPGEVPGWADSFLDQLLDWTSAARGGTGGTLAGFEDGRLAQQVLEDLLGRAGRAS